MPHPHICAHNAPLVPRPRGAPGAAPRPRGGHTSHPPNNTPAQASPHATILRARRHTLLPTPTAHTHASGARPTVGSGLKRPPPTRPAQHVAGLSAAARSRSRYCRGSSHKQQQKPRLLAPRAGLSTHPTAPGPTSSARALAAHTHAPSHYAPSAHTRSRHSTPRATLGQSHTRQRVGVSAPRGFHRGCRGGETARADSCTDSRRRHAAAYVGTITLCVHTGTHPQATPQSAASRSGRGLTPGEARRAHSVPPASVPPTPAGCLSPPIRHPLNVRAHAWAGSGRVHAHRPRPAGAAEYRRRYRLGVPRAIVATLGSPSRRALSLDDSIKRIVYKRLTEQDASRLTTKAVTSRKRVNGQLVTPAPFATGTHATRSRQVTIATNTHGILSAYETGHTRLAAAVASARAGGMSEASASASSSAGAGGDAPALGIGAAGGPVAPHEDGPPPRARRRAAAAAAVGGGGGASSSAATAAASAGSGDGDRKRRVRRSTVKTSRFLGVHLEGNKRWIVSAAVGCARDVLVPNGQTSHA
jgi:hypothetical protein